GRTSPPPLVLPAPGVRDTKLGMTATMLACEGGHAGCLRILAEHSANINLPDTTGQTAVMLAVSADTTASAGCLRYLIRREADLDAQDLDGWSAAMAAACAGRGECLQWLIEGRADLDLRNSKGQTALMLAVMCRSDVCVRALTRAKANVMLKDSAGATAANIAQRTGNHSCLRMLQHRKSNLFSLALMGPASAAPEEDANLASKEWLDAAWLGDAGALEALAAGGDRPGEDGADPCARGPDGWTAAMVASIMGYPRCLELLLDLGVDVGETDRDGHTATMWAAAKGHLECLRVLLDARADPDARDGKGVGAAHLAAASGQKDCLRLLAERGADLDARRRDGSSCAVLYLLQTGEVYVRQEAATPAAEEGAGAEPPAGRASAFRVSSPDRAAGQSQPPTQHGGGGGSAARPAEGHRAGRGGLQPPPLGAPGSVAEPAVEERAYTRSSWFRAARIGRADVLGQLVDQGADIDAASGRGMTAAMVAAENGHQEAVSFLLARGTDVLVTDTLEGTGAVSFAARQGHFECIKVLVDEGDAYVDQKDAQGRTALMEAALHGHERCVRLLIRRGADPNLKAEDGLSVAMMAAEGGRKECLRVLAEHGADLMLRGDGSSVVNVLHIFEAQAGLAEARSVVPAVNWRSAASGGARGLCEALEGAAAAMAPRTWEKTSDTRFQHIAGLHLSLWAYDDWDNLRVRDPQLVEALFGCLVELLTACRDLQLDGVGKRALSLLLDAGLKRALGTERAEQLAALNEQVLGELEKALDERQSKLEKVTTLTEAPDVYFERWDRHNKKTTGRLDQRDAIPEELWGWLVDLPKGCVERLDAAHLCLRKLGLVTGPGTLANFLRDHALLNDNALYARVAAHVLTGYAAIVDPHFTAFMKEHFGQRFKAAPVKKLARIFAKLLGDEPRLADELATAEDPGLRCSYFALGDAVRGSVEANGAEAMIDTVEQLQRLNKLSAHGRFDVWRIKNTHHAGADETTGGYRDVKVLGRFTARKKKGGEFTMPISMIVEVQVIDSVYLDIKKYMHKAYSIDRGDYG
ncbi:unnamed protein product, partial [Prorocentrum cordatum]